MVLEALPRFLGQHLLLQDLLLHLPLHGLEVLDLLLGPALADDAQSMAFDLALAVR